jgi:uncharacterized protein
MNAEITGLYAAPLAVLFIVLSARVISYRRGNAISLGDGGDAVMLARVRAQGNFAEYAPFGVLLMLIAEAQGTAPVWLHLCGGVLLTGRLLHGINFSFGIRNMALRVGGMVLTLTALGLAAMLCLPL